MLVCMLVDEMLGEKAVDVPMGMTALERSHTPSSSLRIVSGERRRRSRAEMWLTVGAAKMAGAKATSKAKAFEKSIVWEVVGGRW